VSIVNKLETYSGCILADSVGLGKTFTALAVIKYYESRNRNVLVLCPKKLEDNWLTYRSNQRNNPVASDRLRYDVLFHTDLSRDHGMSTTGIDLSLIDWGNYDLVVIDESHNFRNGSASANISEGEENRYLRLLNRVVRAGVKTKVLMLSATPVNNRFYDLRNQLALAYDGDQEKWEGKLGLTNDLDTVFQRAQKAFNAWDRLPVEQRTTDELARMLDFDFYRVLDQVTVARSRKHIQRHYDMNALGPFPERNDPVSIRARLTDLPDAINYHEIYEQLDELTLCVYMPSAYLLPSRAAKYATETGDNLTVEGRESGIKKLMATNLLKRLESSVHSFRITLAKIRALVADTSKVIDDFVAGRAAGASVTDVGSSEGLDLDGDDEEEPFFEVGGKTRYEVADLDYVSWQRDLERDLETLDLLIDMVGDITPEHDSKLAELKGRIAGKAGNPINPGNRKVIVFTAFADTASYLYDNLASWIKNELGLETCMVTGADSPKCTIKGAPSDMNRMLTMFSPVSKELDVVMPDEQRRIDVLIATDCISEGQNLQDCDYVVNYDIHWNPVRVIQRFGRIDRIGSRNDVIQLVNFWPDVELDEYIRLKSRVEERMRATVLTSTGDDDLLNANEKGDLEYRKVQLRMMMTENIDLEDVSSGASITDLGLNDFRMDLVDYYEKNPGIDSIPHGLHAVVRGEDPGVAFVLRNVNQGVNIEHRNQLHTFYLVYMRDDGSVLHGHLDPKAVLDEMRLLCRGKGEPDRDLCAEFNRETRDGRNMRAASELLEAAVSSIVDAKEESDVDSFFSSGTTGFLEDDIEGLDDFELICFLVVR
ncbi:MAG: helicase-related protein, partial [Coriobacteriales bacterium]